MKPESVTGDNHRLYRIVAIAWIALSILLVGTPTADARGLLMRPVLQIGDAPDEDPLLFLVTSAVVDPADGSIFLADLKLSCVLRLDAGGALVDRYGQMGEGPGDIPFGVMLAIDRKGLLYITGQGGRVDVLDRNWRYLRSIERAHPDAIPRAIRVADDGRLVIAAPDVLDQTSIDLYSGDGRHLASFCDTYGAGREVDWRAESMYGGGVLDIDREGRIVYCQRTPFEMRVFDLEGELLYSTTAGLSDFVPAPPEPDTSGDGFRLHFSGETTGVEALPDGSILCSALRRQPDNRFISKLCLYDSHYEPVAGIELPGTHTVIGSDPRGRVMVFTQDDAGIRVVLYEITAG